jgi:nucleoside-diphosphate-sugar epimerase
MVGIKRTEQPGFDVVTGAFSYSGNAIARALIAQGRRVRTLTNHPDRASGDMSVEAHPLVFDEHRLRASLQGADTLYNTYWVRFPHGGTTFATAVANSRTLFGAAAAAGVRRIVHVSITNPALDSPYPYFRGKAEVERELSSCGVAYAVARPAILFGGDGVLVNNIAWLLRRFPLVAIGGRGDYRIRAIHIDDLAALCLDLATREGDLVVDAVGPQSLTFRELLECIRAAVGSGSVVLPVPEHLFPWVTAALGVLVRDRLLTPDEYWAMAKGLADSTAPTTGNIAITDWIAANGDQLGRNYANEIVRHFDRAQTSQAR